MTQMNTDEARSEGERAARRDVGDGCWRVFSGTPSQSAWGIDLATTLKARFGVEVVFSSDLTDAAQLAYERGYNEVVESFLDDKFGDGELARAFQEVEVRRKQRYDAHFNPS